MFFDMHSDILYDIVVKRKNKQKNIIKNHHLAHLLNGHIHGGIWNYYTDNANPLCKFSQAIDYILEEIELARNYIHIVKSKNDFKNNKINVILGFESLQPIKDVKHLKKMHKLGFRHAMLTWNEENQFGTGTLGNEQRGLTNEGIKIIEFMNDNKMIVDVSHANKHTFDDIIKYSTKPVIASHSNVFNLCQHKRNLDDNQIVKLTSTGGVIGVTTVTNFINKEKPTVARLVDHIDYLKNMNLINQISLGFDFMDYLKPPVQKNINSNIFSSAFTHKITDELRKRNYSADEINKISYKNSISIINKLL